MTTPDSPLVLGPLLRYVDQTSAAVWVEVAEPIDVTVTVADRDHTAHTFTVHGHHYALVDIDEVALTLRALVGTATRRPE